MKLKFAAIISAMALIAMVCLIILAPKDRAMTVNTNFEMETLYGDPSQLTDFSLTNMIRTGVDSFAKVTWQAGEFTLEETIFDTRFNVNGFQLENREMYRGDLSWAFEAENEQYYVRFAFDSSYFWNRTEPTATLAVMNKQTGKVQTEIVNFPDIQRFEQFWAAGITEVNGEFFAVLRTSQGSNANVYRINPETLSIELAFNQTSSVSGNSWADFVMGGEYLFTIIQEGNNNTQVTRTNLLTQAEKNLDISDFGWVRSSSPDGHLIFHDQNGDMQLFDTDTETLIELEQPAFLADFNPDRGEWIDPQIIAFTDQHLVINYRAERQGSPRTQYVVVYDVNTFEIVYQGSIVLRRDHNFVNNWSIFDVETGSRTIQ